MANGAFKFKDNSGNVVSFISGSGSNISFSGGTLDLSGMTGLTLGNLTLSGTTQNALSASHAASYLLTSSFNTYSGTTNTIIGTLQTSTSSLNSFSSSTNNRLSSIEGVSGSYATTGSNIFNGTQTISGSLNVSGSSHTIQNGYVILQQVSQSLDFADDDAAAVGGVPLGGLYRNGNFILIRVGGSVPALFSGTVNIGYGQCQNEYGTFSVNGNGTTFCNSTELYVYSANSASFSAINDVVGVNYGGQGRIIQIPFEPTFTGSLITACETCT